MYINNKVLSLINTTTSNHKAHRSPYQFNMTFPPPLLDLQVGSSSFQKSLFGGSRSTAAPSSTSETTATPVPKKQILNTANNDFDGLDDFDDLEPIQDTSTGAPVSSGETPIPNLSSASASSLEQPSTNDTNLPTLSPPPVINPSKNSSHFHAISESSVTIPIVEPDEDEDLINFIPEPFNEITYQDKEIPLPNGKTFILKKRKHKTVKPLNSLELSREQSYGLNINDLYVKLEQDRLKNKDQETESYMTNVKVKSKQETLWVEKWRPKNYMDFVGNESTNRKVLRWMKQWDRVVFEKNFKPIVAEDSNQNADSKYQFQRFTDPFGRPERKVLLISGAPGLGKTTISHIIAKMCGYDVMEVNASDERSGQRIRDKVTNSLSSVTFSGKPVCLIADEVDGAAEFGFVKVLLDILSDDAKTLYRFQRSDSTKFFKEKGKNKPKFLLRPIIAICNDLYAPALEKLRSQCELISFKQVNEKSLIERLRHIANAEKLTVPVHKLKEIILLTDYDIRSCLNLLQFGGDLNKNDGQDARKKDMQISWYAIVNELFKKNAKMSKSEQYKRLTDMISVNTNFEKIIHGCFLAYVDVHYQDLKLSKPSRISDWLYFSDLMNKTQYDTAGNISEYSMETALKFFELFSDLSNKNNLQIKSDYEHFEHKKNNINIIKLLFNNTHPHLRTLLKLESIPTEILPHLNHIITSDFKAPNKDQSRPAMALEALKSLGLKITKTKDDNFNDIMTTYPEFTQITKFDKAAVKKQQLKQTVAFPFLLREMDRLKSLKRSRTEMSKSAKTKTAGSDDHDDADGEEVGETSFQVLKDQYEKIAEAEQRVKKPKTEVKVWVKYHEGFSNAVRKRVRWDDLFGSSV